MSCEGRLSICKRIAKQSAIPKTKTVIIIGPGIPLPIASAAIPIHPLPAIISLEKKETYPIDIYAPPIPAKVPASVKAIILYLKIFYVFNK